MLVALTGTPGVGKTTVCGILKNRFNVIDLNLFAKENGCYGDYDEYAGSYDVDTDKVSDLLQKFRKGKTTVMDGHLSHFVDCDLIIVLRCSPSVLSARLSERNYKKEKVIENVQAEILDVILCESEAANESVFEIDCTGKSAESIADAVESIINNEKRDGYAPGKVNWIEEMDEWF